MVTQSGCLHSLLYYRWSDMRERRQKSGQGSWPRFPEPLLPTDPAQHPLLPVAMTYWSCPSHVPSVPPVNLWLLQISIGSGARYSSVHSFPKAFGLEELSCPGPPAPWPFGRHRFFSVHVLAFGQSAPTHQWLFPAGRCMRRPRVSSWL